MAGVQYNSSVLNGGQVPRIRSGVSLPATGIDNELFVNTGNSKLYYYADGFNLFSSGVTGSGTVNQIAKFTASDAIGDSIMREVGTAINIAGYVQLLQSGNPAAHFHYQSSTAQLEALLTGGRVSLRTANTDRLFVHNNGRVSIGNTTDVGQSLNVTGGGRFSTTLSVGGAITADGTLDIIGSAADFKGVGVRNTLTTGFSRLIGARDSGGSGSMLAYVYYTNSAYPSIPYTMGFNNEQGGFRWLGYGQYNFLNSGTLLANFNIDGINRATIGIGGAGVNGASLASIGNQQFFLPNVTTGSQIEAATIKPDGGLVYIPVGAANGAIVNTPGWWGWNGTTFLKIN